MLWVTAPITKAYSEAREAYQAARGNFSPKTSDLVPYAADSTSRAILETYAAYQDAHDGGYSSNTADYLPYATTPQVRSLLESMVRADARGGLRNAHK